MVDKSSPQKEQDDLLINPNDFKGIELKFKITNTTTRTEFTHPEKISLVEFEEGELLLEVPPKNCSVGHNLIVTIQASGGPKKSLKFSTTAKVESVAPASGPGAEMLLLQLLQYEEKEWEEFVGLFETRQKEIEDFFKATRGW